LNDERKLLKMGGWLRMGAGLAPYSIFVGKRKKTRVCLAEWKI
jgi:hypothetical protein